MVYQAVRYQPPGGSPVVIRAAQPLTSLDVALAELRRRLLFASLVIFLIGSSRLL